MELKEKLKLEKLPDKVHLVEQDGKLIAHQLNAEEIPEVTASVVILQDLTFKLFMGKHEVSV